MTDTNTSVHIAVATLADVDVAAPLFDAYRQFYPTCTCSCCASFRSRPTSIPASTSPTTRRRRGWSTSRSIRRSGSAAPRAGRRRSALVFAQLGERRLRRARGAARSAAGRPTGAAPVPVERAAQPDGRDRVCGVGSTTARSLLRLRGRPGRVSRRRPRRVTRSSRCWPRTRRSLRPSRVRLGELEARERRPRSARSSIVCGATS